MKKIYLFIFALTVSTASLTAQNRDTKAADKHYDRLEYTEAIEDYERLIARGKADSYVYERLANSYYNINDTEKAASYYKRIMTDGNVDAESVYNYAQSLKANGDFSGSNDVMKKFAGMKPRDKRAQEFMKNPDYIPGLLNNTPQFTVENAGDINSEFSEFGGTMSGNTMYFSSARNTKRRDYGWNDQPFLDIYAANWTDGTIGSAELIPGDVNTKFHEGTVAFSADGKRIYFDRNNYFKGKYEKDEEGVNQLNLYTAELVNGKWVDVKPLPFNSSEYSTAHPCLSKDGKTLYFVSDMPGGKGMADIYMVSVNADGTYGSPQNVEAVNTEGKEVFPHIADSGTLFFSSDGHPGLGGLDVFKAEGGKITNLGVPVNSGGDDFAFMYDEASMSGFVSSDREGGQGSDDIYQVAGIPPCDVNMMITVVDGDTGAPLADAKVDIYDSSRNRLGSKMTDGNGKVEFMGECDTNYTLTAEKAEYESGTAMASSSENGPYEVRIALNPIEEIIQDDRVVLEPIFFDFDKSNIKPQAAFELDKLVQIMKKYPDMVIRVESHTDNRGGNRYNMQLSERRAQSTVQYVISQGIDASRISGIGKGKSDPLVDCSGGCTDEQHQQNRRSDFIIVKK
ncbi:OmpA family protein [Gilvibacter sediminis]|uniref:OmpA family protein n=1 Tax=Gilvibacter sediminis TaxID=379071 RepID=UPI0023507F31|nr:OmpA family protein [Gilvibacter sediminis]MDC7997067.1 OmpA family protein [Gilvibacter sediminis]